MYGTRFSVAVFVASVGLFACGESSETPSSPTGAAGNGTLRVMLTDSPFSDARSLLVTFSEVTAHRSGEGGFTAIPFAGAATSRTCDLKKLTDAQDVLGTASLAPGHYTQMRLVVSSAALYFDNPSEGPACAPTIAAPAGRSEQIEIPSGEVRLNREFTVAEGGASTILLDFDGDRSVRETGNGRYMMNPVITVLSVQ
jgi:hypothetical protein